MDEQNKNTPPAPDAGQQQQQTPPPETPAKSFTQDDVTRIAAKEARGAETALLKKLGLGEDIKSVTDGLTKYNEWKAAQQSDLDKANEAANTANTALTAANTKAAMLELENACLKNGVAADSVSDVATLAKSAMAADDKLDAEKAIAAIVEKYPQFKTAPPSQQTPPPNKPVFSTSTQTSNPETLNAENEVRQMFGLPPKK